MNAPSIVPFGGGGGVGFGLGFADGFTVSSGVPLADGRSTGVRASALFQIQKVEYVVTSTAASAAASAAIRRGSRVLGPDGGCRPACPGSRSAAGGSFHCRGADSPPACPGIGCTWLACPAPY